MRRWIVLLAFAPLSALAETAYVTDNLRLNVYGTADFSGSAIRTLQSGDAFEVLSRGQLAAHVELDDGTTGYVRSAYIVTDPPARLIVSQTQADNDRLNQELDELRASFAEPAAAIESLQQQTAELTTQLNEATERASTLEEANSAHERRAAAYAYSLPYTWVGGAIFICLIAGFLLGLWWVDRQNRKRHGGIRVY
ncbi:MAG: TIGR04211 family SH3 domain-containing protein [Woeseiaceae bacterium]|nr:TIGR04211 family SH3 domain-containing protein [Woeseiaceae bacterium]